jgi:hypothetical protein
MFATSTEVFEWMHHCMPSRGVPMLAHPGAFEEAAHVALGEAEADVSLFVRIHS